MHLGIFSVFLPVLSLLNVINMVHDQHVFTWHVSAILFFMPCSEPPMGISGVGSFPVQSGGSLIFFPAL